MSTEKLRDEDIKLLQMLEQMRNQIAQSSSSLDSLKDILESVERLVKERNHSMINARSPLLEGFGIETDDQLTGLPGKAAFEKALERVFASGEVFTVVSFDLDGFKEINERFGYPTGDEVLRRIGQLARKALRASDLAGRLGGEEFALILRGITGDRAFGVCERLRMAVQKYPWHQLHPELKVTISLGFASRDDEATAQAVLARADRFQAEAKSSGRNQTFPGMYY
ncbi:GGDEF domain-containing protein [Meiothermus cerbereus]|uniref:GGDEF domain-containing protein n=1 Tax=Meiothermus cerbereus TaxID=65552 RepID=UPI003EF02CD4